MRTPENIQSKKASRSIKMDTNIRDVLSSSMVITHFSHALRIAKQFPSVRALFYPLIIKPSDAVRWLYYFPYDVREVYGLIGSSELWKVIANHPSLITHFYHLITPMNVGRYIGLCQNKHKPLILAALAYNMYYPKSDYSWALRSCPSNLRHHMKYVEHRFSL